MKPIMFFLLFCLFLGGCSQAEPSPAKQSNGTVTASNKADEWKVSPVFTIPKPGPDGKDMPYNLRGVNNKFAILDIPVIAGTNNKQLVHIWGGTPEKTEQLFDKRIKVIGTSKESGKVVTAFESTFGRFNEEIIKPPHYYAESLSYLVLPSKGIWKLDAYVEDKLFGSIVIEAK